MHFERRVRKLERAARARTASATDAELAAYLARRPPDPALKAELATWTDEQVDAARRGVPLTIVRTMQPAAKVSHPATIRSSGGGGSPCA
jgi:hypothetical protein